MTDVPARLGAALTDRYRIVRELGAGGMATVYLAHDLRHDREVALKVLHPELGAVIGADRFLQEIKTTARLQHPHILGLIDSGEADGLLFYVMPYVNGESLRAKLTRDRQLPIAETLRIASEVASALDYAHRQGVVHRDIKPENVLLHDGQAMVADFGIALAVTAAGAGRITQTGISLGTPHYMSPEQALGERSITPRSDVYALGAITYEMLTGEPPFTGGTAQAIISKVMTEKPLPPTATRETVPPHVEDAVLTALAKLPADRWASAREFAEALEAGPAAARMLARAPGRAGRRAINPLIPIGAVAVALVLGLWGWLRAPDAPAAPVTRLRIAMSPGQGLSSDFTQRFAISDDGSRIVYTGEAPNQQNQLWVRELDALDARPIAGTVGAMAPSFSPDGKWVLFVSNQQLRKVRVEGGDITTLADSVNAIAPGGAWLSDGTILFSGSDFQLHTVHHEGGPVSVIPRDPRDSLGRLFPRRLPRDDAALVTGCDNVCNRIVAGVVNLRTGAYTPIAEESAEAWYVPTGHLIVVRRTGAVVAIPFDVDALEVRGDPILLFDGVHVAIGVVPSLTLAPSGTLLYERSGLAFGQLSTLVRVTRNGTATPIDPAWSAAEMGVPAVSPDGKRLAVDMVDGQRSDIWIKQLDRGALSRLTTEGGLSFAPTWRPGGSEIAYLATEGSWHVRIRRPDGTGAIGRVAIPEATTVGAPIWTPDGKWLLIRAMRPGGFDIYAHSVGSDSVFPVAAAPRIDELSPAVSPDGRWVAYASTESGRPEIYLRPFPDVAREKLQVSRNGGHGPAWSRDGRELFFVSGGGELTAVPVTWAAGPTFGEPQALFPVRDFVVDLQVTSFEPEPGGRSFIMRRQAERKAQPQLVIVFNWFEELKARVGR